jgi:hypothetical protein
MEHDTGLSDNFDLFKLLDATTTTTESIYIQRIIDVNLTEWFLDQIKAPIKFITSPVFVDDGKPFEAKLYKLSSVDKLSDMVEKFNTGELKYFYYIAYIPSIIVTRDDNNQPLSPTLTKPQWHLRCA